MRPILLDTNAYMALRLNKKNIVEIVQHATVLAISPVVLGELLGGFECGSKTKQNKLDLQRFLESSRVRLFPITTDTSKFYSQIYFSLKKRGKPIPTNDLWIAAQALEHGCVVCTMDKHFHAIDGLISGHQLEDLIL